MFMFHMIFAFSLLTLTSGTYLYVWSVKNFSTLGKVIGALVMLVSLLNIACESYYGFKHWKAGYFEGSMPMHERPMMHDGSAHEAPK